MRYYIWILFSGLLLLACGKEQAKNPATATTKRAVVAPKSIPVEPVEVYAWVDQLRVRSLPTLDSRVIVELLEGDTLYYLNTETVRRTELTLRDKKFNRPWVKVQTKDGKSGWVYGGGIVREKE